MLFTRRIRTCQICGTFIALYGGLICIGFSAAVAEDRGILCVVVGGGGTAHLWFFPNSEHAPPS